jgi:hypothetical protein
MTFVLPYDVFDHVIHEIVAEKIFKVFYAKPIPEYEAEICVLNNS